MTTPTGGPPSADRPPPPPSPPPAPRVVDALVPWGAPDTRPGQDHRVDLTLLDGIALVVWSLLGQLVIGLLVGVVAAAAGLDVDELVSGVSSVPVLIAVQSGVLAGALAWLAGRRRLTWRVLGPRRPGIVHAVQGVGWGLLAFLVSTAAVWVGATLTGSDDGSGQALLDESFLTGPAFVLVLVLVGVLAPLLEELTFRGVLFQVVGRRVGLVGGLLVSSAVFAAVHVEVLGSGGNAVVFLVALLLVGCVFGLSFNRSRSLVTAVVAHSTFNVVQLLVARAIGLE